MVKALAGPALEIEEGVLSGESEDITNIAEDIDNQISSITSEFGTDKHDVKFTVKVYRVVENRGELAWLFDCTPAELPIMQKLRDEYEGGRFEVRIYRDNRIFKRIKVLVEKSKLPEKISSTKSELAQLVEALATQQANQLNQLKETILQVVGKPTEKAPSMAEVMQQTMVMMTAMKEFIAPQQNTLGPEKMMELFFKGMEFAQEKGGGETGLMDLAKSFLQSPLLEAAVRQPQIAAPVMRAPFKANPQIAGNGTQKPNEVKEAPKVNPVIAYYVNMLLKQAKKDSDPALYADLILDNLPEEQIKQQILVPDLIEKLSTVNPEVITYQNWFNALKAEIETALTGEDETSDTPKNENPNSISNDSNGTARNPADS